ncbi:MAG: peptidylprolyl isomerase [Coriobacteriia bacterium]|nr:peptidylprolyl isomerase [Coriobacteriia bacterium]
MENTFKKSLTVIGAVIVSALLAITICGCAKKSDSKTSSSSDAKYSADNFKQTDAVEIQVANYGTIKVGLDANAAPITVANFKQLVSDGFYNGLTFHRIISGFMMQGGDPKGDGTGGSEKTIKGEFTENGVNNLLAHTRGAISMARSSANDSASSQFFIVHQTSSNNSKSLDGKYCCFGYVLEGMEVVDKIIADAKPTDSNGTIPAASQPKITSIKLL